MEPIKKEDRFLLLCARTQMQPGQLDLAAFLAKDGLNWNYLFSKAKANSVTALIYKNLLKLGIDLPETILENFKNRYIIQRLANERRWRDLAEVLKALNLQKISALVHKGAALGENIYGDIAFRPMSDMDILVKQKDWPKIREILDKLEYSLLENPALSILPKEYHIPCLSKRRTGIEFKFNFYWLDIPEFNPQSVWEDALPAEINGEKTLVPSPEDHLLILSLGLLRHRYTGLIWFCDIHECIRHYQGRIDWEKLIKKAKVKGVSAFLYYGLFLTDKMLGIQTPPSILKRLRPNLLRRRLFAHFHLLDNIVSLNNCTEKKRSTPKSHLLQLFLIGKIGLNLKIMLKSLLYFLQLALQSKKSTKRQPA